MSDESHPPTLRPPAGPPHFPQLESEVLAFWDREKIYQRSLDNRDGADPFVFFEGPPTANGLPHPGHCLTRVIKDVFPRYQTMRGRRCLRKAGWDTHGLPVEVEVSKEIGIHNRDEIVAYGEEAFIQKCRDSVFGYIEQWQTMTRRLGFWVDLDDAYVTYHQSYVESVWWSLKNLFDRGLLYHGHKIVWWWAQGGTALSSGEVGQGYREVADPSVYVKFPLIDDDGNPTRRSLVVWTTTPWTLPSNQYAAVAPRGVDYVVVKIDNSDDASRNDDTQSSTGGPQDTAEPRNTAEPQHDGEELIIASELLESVQKKLRRKLTVVEPIDASELIGRRYQPPFDHYVRSTGNPSGATRDGGDEPFYWRVLGADFVTTDSGTGIVHLAPAFGQIDYEVYQELTQRFTGDAPEVLYCVGSDGKFTDVFELAAGMWVKDADRVITRELKSSGRMLIVDQYVHEYPFCWRAKDDPLIQYPRSGWFLRTTMFKDLMLENNARIGWQPEHIRDGRFGNFLASNVDWELSRERFWGTPLPIWVCDVSGRAEAIASYDELMAKPGVAGTEVWTEAKAADPSLVDDLKVHKPYIDAVTYDSPFDDGGTMRRVSDVIDCWYDSGSMPFAQYGWPHSTQDERTFADQYPADFISEAIDQTRGWFYSQLAIATMLFGRGSSITAGGKTSPVDDRVPDGARNTHAALCESDYPLPFKNCIVLGLMVGEDGKKLSKQDRNYREPREIFDKFGSDALRWFLLAGQPPWTSIQYREQTIKDSIPEFLLRLWNVYSFLTIYAEIDGFDLSSAQPGGGAGTAAFATGGGYRPIAQRSEIDRWILSRLNQTIAVVTERMDALDNYNAAAAITDLVDALSNWYVRRNRDRFWAAEKDSPDKLDAFWTLYEVLVKITQLAAPFTPFLSETLWGRLTEPLRGGENPPPPSVHLCDYPTSDPDAIDAELSTSMELLREIASLGRAARADAKLKVRQPLSDVTVVLSDASAITWLKDHDELIRKELNVDRVTYTTEGEKFVEYSVVPNFRALGPRVGKAVPKLKTALAAADAADLLRRLKSDGRVDFAYGDGESIPLGPDDLQVRLSARDGHAAAQGSSCVVVLNTEVTPELRRRGIAGDVLRAIQNARKDIDCGYTDRIDVGVQTDNDEVRDAVREHAEHLAGESLADSITDEVIDGIEPIEIDLGCKVSLYVRRKPS